MIKIYRGDNIIKHVKDGRTLKALSNKGFFAYPIDKGHSYIDEEMNSRNFEYKGKCYIIEYRSGCFYPFLFEILGQKIGYYNPETIKQGAKDE